MNRSAWSTMLRMTASVTLLGSTLAGAAGCGVEVGPEYPGGDYGYYPSDGFIATTEPFYYEGRANYWYGGRWYYRNGGGWGHYGGEPGALYQRRMQSPQRRRTYEQYGGHAGRSGSPGGRSGGRR
jgi:hypothetical protein